MELETLYFYTATITNWKKLLAKDKYKDLIISSLKYLIEKKKIVVYGYVIMPNHIHLIWELLTMNGKEMPHASFMKYTSHEFLKDLTLYHPQVLEHFIVESSTRQHQFWKRNPLPIELYSREVIEQKLDYIHNNPVQEKWSLAPEPAAYLYSSAAFYETGVDKLGIATNYLEKYRQ